ncbi:MAG: shikimate dehydrogenase, partial [Opitutaceae bacterium]
THARPERIHVADRIIGRLEHLQRLHASWPDGTPLVPHHTIDNASAGDLLKWMPPGSLIVNATGVGKDTPGSPLPAGALFPESGLVWEFNYRGDLLFLEQARAQQASRNLRIEAGWNYFLHGWTRVIADVFNREIPTEGPVFDALGRLAASVRG